MSRLSRLTNHFDYCDFIGCKYANEELARINQCDFLNVTSRDKCHDRKIYEKLREYEDLEEQGRLIKLPCKVGDELFVHHRTFKGVIVEGVCVGYTWWRTDGFCAMFHSDTPTYGKEDIAFSEFGKTVFLTKEEAEAKLAELKEGAE